MGNEKKRDKIINEEEIKYKVDENLYIVGGKYSRQVIERREEKNKKSLKKLIENVRENSKSF